MTTPDPFAPGYRLTDGNQLNDRIANPQWSTTSSIAATPGGNAFTSAKVVNAITNITTASVAGAGITLPQALMGKVLIIYNDSANDVRVFAEGDSSINGLSGLVGIILQKGTTGIFTAVDTQQWSQLNAIIYSIAWDDVTGKPTAFPPTLPTASAIGGVKAGSNITIAPDGTISAASPTASSVTNIAALKALTVTSSLVVIVEGYYSAGDGGGGYFYGVTGAAPGTYVDNGGTIILPTGGDGSSAWRRAVNDMYNVRWFGAKGDLSQDDAPAIQSCVNVAAGNTIYAPVGKYALNSGITTNIPLNILGDGTGAGPGGGAQSNNNVTQFILNYPNPSGFTVTSLYPSTFRNFQINVWPTWRPAGNGAGITLTYDGANTASSIIENVAFNWLCTAIKIHAGAYIRITKCYFGNWTQDAIWSDTQSPIEGSLGFVNQNFFFGNIDGTQRSCIYLQTGYTIIAENEILGAQRGVYVNNINHPAGFIRVINNTIEEQYYEGVYITSSDSNDITMVDISGNEFSTVTNGPTYLSSITIGDEPNRQYIQDISITNNTFRHLPAAPSNVGLGYIRLAAGKNVTVSGNLFESLGGATAALGIGISGVANNNCFGAPISVLDNSFVGTFTQYYNFYNVGGVGVTFRDQIPLPFAKLPAVRDGSLVYVSDGQATGATYTTTAMILTSGGTGCFALRIRSGWYVTGPFV